MTRYTPCPDCVGTGFTRSSNFVEDCAHCKGRGQVEIPPPPKVQLPWPATPDGDLVRELNEMEVLTSWEIDFVNGLTERLIDRGVELSPRQRSTGRGILERLGK